MSVADRVTSPSTPETTVPVGSAPTVTVAALCGLVVVGVAAIAAASFVARLEDVIGLTLAAASLAVLTLPIQQWLQRWVGTVTSMVATALASLVGALLLANLVLQDLSFQAEAVADLVRTRLDEVQPGSLADRVVTALRLDAAIDEWLAQVPSLVIVGDGGGTQVGRQLVALLMVIILATFFQSSGRSIVNWVTSRWPRELSSGAAVLEPAEAGDLSPRLIARNFISDLERRGVASVRRSIVLAGVSAVVVGVACQIVGHPGAVVVGIWAGVWFVVPALGWAIGLMPIALLTALDGRPLAIYALIVSVVCSIATTLARRRYIDAVTMRIGVGPYVLSVGIGVAVAGIGGSLVVLVLGSVICAGLTNPAPPGRPPGWVIDARHARSFGGITVPTGWRGGVVAVAAACAGVLLWAALHRMAPAIVWLLIGVFVAIALSRPIGWLEARTRLTHHMSAALALSLLGVVLVLVAITGADDGARATTTITERLPDVVADLEETRFIGGWLSERDASVWIAEQMNDLPQRLGGARPDQWLPTIGARLLDMFWTTLFAIAILLDGPRMLNAVHRRIPARHRRQYARIVSVTGTALGGYAAGAALVAGINGGVVFLLALALGVGLAPVLAVWAFIWNFVPQIGGFMGGLPLILFAFVAGPVRGLVAGVLFIAYQFVENHLIQPAVIGAAIDVAPWGTLLAALAGGAAAGVIGAIVITPLVGVIRTVRAELARDDFPGATARVEHSPAAD